MRAKIGKNSPWEVISRNVVRKATQTLVPLAQASAGGYCSLWCILGAGNLG